MRYRLPVRLPPDIEELLGVAATMLDVSRQGFVVMALEDRVPTRTPSGNRATVSRGPLRRDHMFFVVLTPAQRVRLYDTAHREGRSLNAQVFCCACSALVKLGFLAPPPP